MTWAEARGAALHGIKLRRAAWTDRWITCDRSLWYISSFDQVTRVMGEPRLVRATDWSEQEFLATDWTTDDIPEPDNDQLAAMVSVASVELPAPPNETTSVAYTWTHDGRVPAEQLGLPRAVASIAYSNPYDVEATCTISGGADDDVYVDPPGMFKTGGPVAYPLLGSGFNADDLVFTVAARQSVRLDAWNVIPGNSILNIITVEFRPAY